MKHIPLTQGKFALVDDSDFEWLNQWSWCTRKKKENCFYAGRNDWLNKRNHILLMERQIMKPAKGMEVDHKNGNSLDNRRHNLRICTRRQNLKNQAMHKNNKCGFKGVYWSYTSKKWCSKIFVDGKSKNLGVYFCIIEAARAYDKAAMKYHGEFARLNNV